MDIETQEQMLEELKSRGISAHPGHDLQGHQGTSAGQGFDRKRCVPLRPSERKGAVTSDTRLRNIFKEGVISVDVAQNIVVVKTMPGLASAACSALDNMEIPGIVGSLAGDDTGILIMRDSAAPSPLTARFTSC